MTQKQKSKRYIYILVLMLAGAAAFAVRWAGMEYIAGDYILLCLAAALWSGIVVGIDRKIESGNILE